MKWAYTQDRTASIRVTTLSLSSTYTDDYSRVFSSPQHQGQAGGATHSITAALRRGSDFTCSSSGLSEDSCVSNLKLKELLPQIFSVDFRTRPVRLSGLKSWQCGRTCSTSTTIVVSINVHSTGLCMLVSILPPWTSLLHWWYPREMIYTTSGMVLMVLSFQRDSAGSLPA